MPLQHASILKVCTVVNDDDLSKEAVKAASFVNGHLMHSFVDEEGMKRQAFYSCSEVQKLPDNVASLIGNKRTRDEAFGDQFAMTLKHFRDYAFA